MYSNPELRISMRNNCGNWGTNYKATNGFELRPHPSGFDGEWFLETEIKDDLPKSAKARLEFRNSRAGILNDLEKVIGERYMTLSPFTHMGDWEETFKDDISEFYKLLNCNEYDGFFPNENDWIELHFGIWKTKGEECGGEIGTNCEKYMGWRYCMIKFPFDFIETKHDEILSKINAFRSYYWEDAEMLFFFEKFNVQVFVNIMKMHRDLLAMTVNLNQKISKFTEQLLIEEDFDKKLNDILNVYAM